MDSIQERADVTIRVAADRRSGKWTLTRSAPCLLLAFVSLLELISSVHLTTGAIECPRLLGLGSGAIADWQISSSSSLAGETHEKLCHAKYGRLHQGGNRSWCARHRAVGEWILVDLGVQSQVSGILTQGREEADEWVTLFTVSYSSDAFKWSLAADGQGNRRVLRANSDSTSVRYNLFDQPLEARFIRIHVMEWHGWPSLRLEIVGCQECNQIVTESPNVKVTASSSPTAPSKKNACLVDSVHLFTQTGWCAKKNDPHQWIQFDLGPARQITGVVTRGHGGFENKRHGSWVTSYTVSWSNDTFLWFTYRDGNHLDPKIFGANMDKGTERRHYLNHPFVARFVRIHPQTWHNGIGLRMALLGCPHRGECGPGFFRINSVSGCVENMAYMRDTWLNDKRHLWKDWKYGRASLAVDGDADSSLHRCAILDNYFVEHPVWMVDLGRKVDVNGVVIITWQGKGQDKTASYRDYLANLDKLSVYVANKPRLEASDLMSEPACGAAGRTDDAVFQPQLHIQCHEDVRGRYLYIRASPAPNRKSRLFFSVLCEVMVY